MDVYRQRCAFVEAMRWGQNLIIRLQRLAQNVRDIHERLEATDRAIRQDEEYLKAEGELKTELRKHCSDGYAVSDIGRVFFHVRKECLIVAKLEEGTCEKLIWHPTPGGHPDLKRRIAMMEAAL